MRHTQAAAAAEDLHAAVHPGPRSVHKVAGFDPPSAEENFLFVNAWNEWAEGNHMEPCAKYGDGFLKAFANGLASGLEKNRARRSGPS